MRRIAINTINDYNNYGNRLQNYATQEVLKSLGHKPVTLINDKNYNKELANKKKWERGLYRFQQIKNMSFREFSSKVSKRFFSKKENTLAQELLNKRISIFKDFTEKYISEIDCKISELHVPEDLPEKYDYFITGSDQVWNPNFYNNGTSVDFLTFAPKEKRVAYAPSFGVSEIPDNYAKKYKVWLSEMAHLSVRETAGAEIIKNLTSRNAPVLVDPTLMLTKEEWLKVSKKPSNKPGKRYLLTYLLGEISEERMEYIRNISKEHDLDIVNLARVEDEIGYLTGPSEFIDYINTASIFMTDSFHGAVFSILLETPFIIFDREGSIPSMNSRIDTLLTTFNLKSRLAKNVKTSNQLFEADYSHVGPILDKERKKAIDYLKRALK